MDTMTGTVETSTNPNVYNTTHMINHSSGGKVELEDLLYEVAERIFPVF